MDLKEAAGASRLLGAGGVGQPLLIGIFYRSEMRFL